MNPGHFPFDKELIAEMKKEIYQAGGLALNCRSPVFATDLQQYTGRSLYVAGKRYGVKAKLRPWRN